MKAVAIQSYTVEFTRVEVEQIERALNNYEDKMVDNLALWEEFDRLVNGTEF